MSSARRSRWSSWSRSLPGSCLMTSYSPSSSMAWASVFYISHEMWWGWFIRGVHHFAAQAMVVLIGPAPAPGSVGGRVSPAARVQLVVRDGPPVPDARLQPDRLPAARGTRRDTGRPRSRPTSWVGRQSPGLTCKRSWSAVPTTATRPSRGFTACTSACCPPCWSSAWRSTSALFRRHGITAPPDAEQRPTAQFWPEQLFMDTVFSAGVLSGRDFPGAGRRGSQPRRTRRSLELRLPRAAGVVFPLAVSDAQALSRQPGDHRHDRDPDGTVGRHDVLAVPGSNFAPQAGPFPGLRLRIRGCGGRAAI